MAPEIAAALAGSAVTGLFNQRSANKQMGFQDAQSRTQYQRAVSDMKAAGLNPMLAAKLGGNAAMSGASATMPDLGATYNSAQNVRQLAPVREAEAQLKQVQAQVADMSMYEIDARIENLNAQTKKLGIDTDLSRLNVEEKRMVVTMDQALMEKDKAVYLANKRPILNTLLTGLTTGIVSIGEFFQWAAETAVRKGREAAPEIKKGAGIIVEILTGE